MTNMLGICKKNITICWSKYGEGNEQWKLFKIEPVSNSDLTIAVSHNLTHQYGVDILPPQEGKASLICKGALVSADDDWSHVSVTLLDGKEDGLEGALIASIMTHLSTRNGLMFHASLIDVSGNGILFIGPSGIGKTTQAELWNRCRDAVIINGDMALVHYDGETYWGHGCPWHGSSPYCENRKVPLKGIVVLEQAPENQLERLTGIRMIERVTQNVFLPKWYQTGTEAAMETLDGLLSEIPVYLLRCRPDEAAVELVENTLFGGVCGVAEHRGCEQQH